jgi:hypothetical protein
VLVLLTGLGRAGGPPLVVRAGSAAAAVAAALLAVLQAVDGVALYRAVRAVAAAPPEQRAAAFADAETVRWIEEAVAGYAQIALGLAVLALACAVLAARGLPRWTGVLPAVAGVGFVVQGVHVGYAGFTDTPATLVSWLALAVFALVAVVTSWVRRRP